MKKYPSKERLHEIFNYNPETGIVTRKVATANAVKVGDIVGTIHSHKAYKHHTASVDSSEYNLARLIWVYMTGEVPNIIDHISGDALDNRWLNIRNVDSKANAKNASLNIRNKTGVTGVEWIEDRGRYRASVRVNGKLMQLGRYKSIFDASAVAISARNKAGFHQNHGRKRQEYAA